MVKKLKSQSSEQDKQLANAVRNSAQQIWQAGLGAFAKAQEEGGKVFSKLVKDGSSLQKRTQKLAEEKVSTVTDTVSKVADGVSKQASGSWDKLEQVFEERVARALSSMGVPTQKDIQLLTKRVEQLSKAVAELSGKKGATTPAEPSEPKPRKSALKSVAESKTTSKPTANAAGTSATAKKTRTKSASATGKTASKPKSTGKPVPDAKPAKAEESAQ